MTGDGGGVLACVGRPVWRDGYKLGRCSSLSR